MTTKVLPEQEALRIPVSYKTESIEHKEATAYALLLSCKAGADYERLGFRWVDQVVV